MITVQASGISEYSQTETGHREFHTEVVYKDLVTYAKIL